MFPTDDLTKHEKSIQDAYLSIHEDSPNPGGDAPDADVTKMVRQAVYDIRYKARKEDIPLERAYSAYMGHTSMGPKARAMVKAKLFGETVEEEVITEKKVKSTQPEKTETKKDGKSAKLEKYLKNRRTKRADEHDRNLSGKEAPEGKDPVRVTDPESGKTDYTYADPKKIEKIRRKGLKVERGGTGRPGDKEKGKKILKASFSNWRGNTDELAVRRAIEIKEGCPPPDNGSELNGMKKDVKPKSKVKLKGKVSPKSPNVTIMPDSKVDESKLSDWKRDVHEAGPLALLAPLLKGVVAKGATGAAAKTVATGAAKTAAAKTTQLNIPGLKIPNKPSYMTSPDMKLKSKHGNLNRKFKKGAKEIGGQAAQAALSSMDSARKSYGDDHAIKTQNPT